MNSRDYGKITVLIFQFFCSTIFRFTNHSVRILITNGKKIKHSQFLCLGLQNCNRDQGKKEFLNSHDGQKSYLLTCASPPAHVGRMAGAGQQVTFLAIVGIQKFLFSLILTTILEPLKKKLVMFNFSIICHLNSNIVYSDEKENLTSKSLKSLVKTSMS